MKPILRSYRDEEDYWRIRQFLREVFIMNDRREHSWHVSRWDYLQWHMITNCQVCPPLEEVTSIWENTDGQIAAVMNPLDPDEAFLHIHPAFRTPELEQEMIAHAEQTFTNIQADGMRRLYVPVDEDDQFRKDILQGRGYAGIGNLGFEHYRDLDAPIPEPRIPPGYAIRSMGGVDEHPARSWASWQAFHPDEPDEDYDPDVSWYQNIQRATAATWILSPPPKAEELPRFALSIMTIPRAARSPISSGQLPPTSDAAWEKLLSSKACAVSKGWAVPVSLPKPRTQLRMPSIIRSCL
jgi:mycothiol synthase